jgi:type II secretory pathway component PulK
MAEEDAQALATAVRDWLDKDGEPAGEFGAETEYYQTLETPYESKNNVLASLAELRLIRGVTDLLYFGKEGEPGLKDLLTVYSDGKININTAGPLILQTLVSPRQTGRRALWNTGRNRCIGILWVSLIGIETGWPGTMMLAFRLS